MNERMNQLMGAIQIAKLVLDSETTHEESRVIARDIMRRALSEIQGGLWQMAPEMVLA